MTAVFPVVCEVSSPDHVWCRGGGGDPILVGILVKEGVLKRGTPLCVERKGQPDARGRPTYLDIGRVTTMEKDRKPVDIAKPGTSVSVKIDAVMLMLKVAWPKSPLEPNCSSLLPRCRLRVAVYSGPGHLLLPGAHG